MNAETWQQLKVLFHAALELEPSERVAFLTESCEGNDELRSQVEKLLASHDEPGAFLISPALVSTGGISEDARNADAEDRAGQRIGPYEIVREIGHGGMGTVFLAIRADDQYRKQVAIKLVNRGMDTDAILRRFMMERQILANLEHLNIARLLEGGSTADGLPYFVMEYIEGQPITEYCDAQSFVITPRLELFRQVCAALQYAHQNLVVHRDIKPSNILVTSDGVPKLLDFGIAKLMSPDWNTDTTEATASMFRLMTPEYASPEQLRGLSITTGSDVYSLGIVLYELLSGRHPFRLPSRQPDEVAEVILREEPERPSAVGSRQTADGRKRTDDNNRRSTDNGQKTNPKSEVRNPKFLRGDLDNIVLKAVRKEPERRYASVQEFSEDIRRHLEGLPVIATPDTFGYRAGKFVRRNRTGVLAAAIVVITLLSATAITTWQARVARRERDKAERRFNQVRKLANSVLFEYHDGVERLPGSTPIRQKMIADAIEYLDNLSSESGGDAALQRELATAYEKIGDVQGNPYRANLGNQDGALASYRKALSMREALYAANRGDAKIKMGLSTSYTNVASILWAKGDNEGALANYRKALANYSELAQADPKNTEYANGVSFALIGIGTVQRQSGDSKGALETSSSLLANAEAVLATDVKDQSSLRNVAIANLKVGDAFMGVTDYADALPHYEKAVEGFSELASLAQNSAPTVRLLALGYARLAIVYSRLTQYEKAAEFNLKAIEQQKQVAVADPANVQGHFDIAATYTNLSDNYLRIKRLDEAATSVREAIRIFSEGLARNPDFLQAQGNLGETYVTYAEVLLAKREINAALENYRKALSILEREPVRSAQTRTLADAYEGLGEGYAALAADGRTSAQKRLANWREARSWFQKSREILQSFRDAGKLAGEDSAKLDAVNEGLAKCDAAIAHLTRT